MRMAKAGQTEDVLHRKANETASMALGSKKKYSWMMGGGKGGGGGGASGASTPKINTGAASTSGASTPALAPVDRALQGLKRTYGDSLEMGDAGRKVQVRDIIHVMELDGKERKTMAAVLAKLKNSEKDEERSSATTAR